MRWSVFSASFAVLLVLIEPVSASPQRPVRPRAQSAKAQAKVLFARANKLVRVRKYAAAIDAFKKAYALWKHPTILYNMALAYAFSGQHVEAATQARRYLKKHPLAPGKRLPKLLRNSMARTAVLVVQLPNDQATIYVDGRFAGRGRAEIVVLPGRRAIDVRVKDRVVAHKIVSVAAGKEKTWELAEIPRPRGQPRARARPRPRLRERPSLGGRDLRPSTATTKPKGIHWAYFTVAASLTAASLAGAIALSVLTKSAYEDNKADPSPASKDRGERLQNTANALWGVTAAMAVTATVLGFFTRFRNPERSQARITPTPFHGGMGLAVTW